MEIITSCSWLNRVSIECRFLGDPINLLEAQTIFFLSLWKTYVGPALGVGFDMTYIEAVGYTMMGAGVAVYTTLYFERALTRFFRRLTGLLPGQGLKERPRFKPGLRKVLRLYKRYGFWGLMALTPILIGLPLGVWMAVRLGSSKFKVAVTVLLMALFWSSLSYMVALNGLEQFAT